MESDRRSPSNMNPAARRIQRTYLTLLLGNTLAASFIWGINTLFLLDAGLSNLEAFAANAFFTAGMVIFEVPTGVVADTWGRRTSYLLGTLTLAASTFVYYLLWVYEGPFWLWALVSIGLGLGFTFFSGAVEAWLVDALHHAEYDGDLEAVFGRGQMIGGAAMLGGSVAGGVIAQVSTLGVPFLLRVGVLLVMFAVAWRLMFDLGFTPERGASPLGAVRNTFVTSLDHGLKNPPVRWVMLAAPFTSGVGFYTFYALQPYLLDLYGDSEAYAVAGLAAAIVAGSQIAGGYLAPRIRARFHRRTTPLILGTLVSSGDPRPPRICERLLARARAARRLGPDLRGRDADPTGVPERDDPVAAARDRALVRLAHGELRRRGHPAGARQVRRRVELRDVVRHRRRIPGHGRAVPSLEPARELAVRRHGRLSRSGRARPRAQPG